MLDAALKVVQAARELGLIEERGVTRSTLDRHSLAKSLRDLRAAIDLFDLETANGFATPDLVATPSFATPPQIDDEGVDDLNINLTPNFQPGFDAEQRRQVLTSTMENGEPKPGMRMDEVANSAFAAALTIPAMRRAAKPGMNADYSDLEPSLLFDDDESVGAFLIAIDRIEDKLEYAVAKNGWNPRLKNLAHAMLEMRKRLILEVKQDGAFIRIPAEVFSGLTSTIADAVLDADMRTLVPSLRPSLDQRRDNDLENRYAFRPD